MFNYNLFKRIIWIYYRKELTTRNAANHCYIHLNILWLVFLCYTILVRW